MSLISCVYLQMPSTILPHDGRGNQKKAKLQNQATSRLFSRFGASVIILRFCR